MNNFIIKDNTGCFLLQAKNLAIPNKQKEFLVWEKILRSFHYDEEANFNFIFINHPLETYVGFSIQTAPDNLIKKMKRYAEGLLHKLLCYFPQAEITLLSEDEILKVVKTISSLQQIPRSLVAAEGELGGDNDEIHLLFARVIDNQILMDKFYQFYTEYKKVGTTSIEHRMGVKPKCDERILQVLPHGYLAYSFYLYNTKEIRDKHAETGRIQPKTASFLKEFLEHMSVPDKLVQQVKDAENSSDLFDTPNIVLVPPNTVAELLLGYQ